MKEHTLSIFIDESGDIGEYQPHSPFYIMTLVFHDQQVSLRSHINTLDMELSQLGIRDAAIHTAPLIRREGPYSGMLPNDRRKVLTRLFFFTLKSPICYKSFVIEKKNCTDRHDLEMKLAELATDFFQNNRSLFQPFTKTILYYDNGQKMINRILNNVFAKELPNVEMRRIHPENARLFQVADLLCTLELVNAKSENQKMSKSEQLIFHSRRDFHKEFFRGLKKKEL